MGHGRPRHSTRSRARDGESAVTPVIGAILILVITILGIAGVLYWGAPMIERIQAQNAQVAIVGEFQDLRDASSVLSVPDHSRFPTIVVPSGELNLGKGTRIMVTSNRDAGYTNCDFRVTQWADTTAPTAVSISTSNCRPSSTIEIYQVSGATLIQKTVTGSYTVTGADFSTGDWLFRLKNSACSTEVGSACAEAWLHSGDRVSWALDTSAGDRQVSFDGGAIFSDTAGTQFLERAPVLGDSVFGAGYYGLWLRSLTASSYNVISGAGSYQVYLSLLGNYDRVESASVYRMRFDFHGDLAEAWCNSLVVRNLDLPDGSDAGTVADASYKADGATPCATIDAAGARSVCFSQVVASSNACTSTGSAFTFRFLHARIYTSLAF